jgi:hypothetical protein
MFYDRTRRRWPFDTSYCLIEVPTLAGFTVRLFEIRVPLFQGPTQSRNANSTVQNHFSMSFFFKFCPQCQMHLPFMFTYIHIFLLPKCTTCNALNGRTVMVEYWLTFSSRVSRSCNPSLHGLVKPYDQIYWLLLLLRKAANIKEAKSSLLGVILIL